MYLLGDCFVIFSFFRVLTFVGFLIYFDGQAAYNNIQVTFVIMSSFLLELVLLMPV